MLKTTVQLQAGPWRNASWRQEKRGSSCLRLWSTTARSTWPLRTSWNLLSTESPSPGLRGKSELWSMLNHSKSILSTYSFLYMKTLKVVQDWGRHDVEQDAEALKEWWRFFSRPGQQGSHLLQWISIPAHHINQATGIYNYNLLTSQSSTSGT